MALLRAVSVAVGAVVAAVVVVVVAVVVVAVVVVVDMVEAAVAAATGEAEAALRAAYRRDLPIILRVAVAPTKDVEFGAAALVNLFGIEQGVLCARVLAFAFAFALKFAVVFACLRPRRRFSLFWRAPFAENAPG